LTEIKKRKAKLVNELHELELKLAKKLFNNTKDETQWKEIKIAENETLTKIRIKSYKI